MLGEKKLSRDHYYVRMEIGMRDCLRNNIYYCGLRLVYLHIYKLCQYNNYAYLRERLVIFAESEFTNIIHQIC